MRVHNSMDFLSTLKHFGLRNLGLRLETAGRLGESSKHFIMKKRCIFRHLTKNEKRELSFFSLIHVKT